MNSDDLNISLRPTLPHERELIMQMLAIDPFKACIWEWQFGGSTASTETCLVAYYNNQLVGFNGLIPVRLWSQGKEQQMYWSCDFVVQASCRGTGIGTTIKKSLLSHFSDKIIASFGISDLAYPVLLTQGWRPSASPREFRRQFNASGFWGATKKLVQIGNQLIGLIASRRANAQRVASCTVLTELPSTDLVDNLWHQIKADYCNIVIRDWRYLNWRYQLHPIAAENYQYLCCFVGSNALEAILITRRDNTTVHIVDYLGPKSAYELKRALLEKLLLENSDATSFSFTASDAEWQQVARDCGFFASRNAPRFVVKSPTQPKCDDWFLMKGDCDGELLEASLQHNRHQRSLQLEQQYADQL